MRTSHARPCACALATLAAHVVAALLFKSQDCRSQALEQVWKLELRMMQGGLDSGPALLGSVTLAVVHAQSVSDRLTDPPHSPKASSAKFPHTDRRE